MDTTTLLIIIINSIACRGRRLVRSGTLVLGRRPCFPVLSTAQLRSRRALATVKVANSHLTAGRAELPTHVLLMQENPSLIFDVRQSPFLTNTSSAGEMKSCPVAFCIASDWF